MDYVIYFFILTVGYQENFMTVISQIGKIPHMDGAQINATPIPLDSVYEIYRFPVSEGVHFLQSNAGFGVMSYGYNCDVSYAYPGGLNLEFN